MNRSFWTKIIIMMIPVTLMLTGCNNSGGFVETVTTQISDDNQEIEEVSADNNKTESAPVSTSSVDEISLDNFSDEISPDNLPDELQNMVPLCDAISQVQVETARIYSATDAHLIWKSLRIALTQSGRKRGDMNEANGYLYVNHERITSYAYAMYGQMSTLPNIPDDMIEGAECRYQSSPIDGELCECFSMGDRGLSTARVDAVTVQNDASVELTVTLVDLVDETEIASFTFSLRPNSKNTSKSAQFQYEIVGSKAADDFTATRMSKTPYLVPVVQLYGANTSGYLPEGSDEFYKYNCLEILNYTCFGDSNVAMVRLNERIETELTEQLNEDDEGWKRITSYPVSGNDYIQVVSHVSSVSDGNITNNVYCYNYDKRDRAELKKEDALLELQLSEENLIDKVYAACAKSGIESVEAVEYCGFLANDDGTFDLYVKLNLAEADEYGEIDKIAMYSTGNGSLTVYNMYDDIVEKSIEDVMIPTLTHGRDN